MKETGAAVEDRVEIKVVGKSGQISLGKRYAGKTLRLERREDGTVLLTAVAMVPESQLWTLQEPHRARIERGLAWAARTPPAETELDDLVKPRRSKAGHKRARG
jgi:hypothetical protein